MSKAVPVDYYAILGVDENATREEIHASWKKLVRIWHPDRYPEGEREHAMSMATQINEAWQTLKNDELRQKYDIENKIGGLYSPAVHEAFSDHFDQSSFHKPPDIEPHVTNSFLWKEGKLKYPLLTALVLIVLIGLLGWQMFALAQGILS